MLASIYDSKINFAAIELSKINIQKMEYVKFIFLLSIKI
jgi:hypothetical protein